MGKGNCGAFADVVMDVFFIGICLQFIGHGKHDQITPSRGFGDAHYLQPFGFGFLGGCRAFAQRNNQVFGATVAQVQRMGVALRAIAKNGHFGVFNQIDIAIAVIVNAHGFVPCFRCEVINCVFKIEIYHAYVILLKLFITNFDDFHSIILYI